MICVANRSVTFKSVSISFMSALLLKFDTLKNKHSVFESAIMVHKSQIVLLEFNDRAELND